MHWHRNSGTVIPKVKFLGMDNRGKIRLSMKVVDQATGEDLSAKQEAAAPADAE